MSKHRYQTKTINGVKQPIHRHLMEEHLGRSLNGDEHVYHLNGDSQDQRIENLVVVKKTYEKPIVKKKKKSNFEAILEEMECLKKRISELENQ